MNKLIFLFAFLLITVNISAQLTTDSIQIKKRLGPVFQKDGRNLTPKNLLDITKPNPDAYAEMKLANSNYVASMFFQLPGGFLIGYPIGTALGGGDPNWTMAAIGASLVIISIPLISGYNRHATNAVNIYNKGISSASKPLSLRLGFNPEGIGMKICF